LKVWPKAFSFGQASWQAEHGKPYFLAKAGKARIPVSGAAAAVGLHKKATRKNGAIKIRSEALHPRTPFLFFA
jgi:hypothetical protein